MSEDIEHLVRDFIAPYAGSSAWEMTGLELFDDRLSSSIDAARPEGKRFVIGRAGSTSWFGSGPDVREFPQFVTKGDLAYLRGDMAVIAFDDVSPPAGLAEIVGDRWVAVEHARAQTDRLPWEYVWFYAYEPTDDRIDAAVLTHGDVSAQGISVAYAGAQWQVFRHQRRAVASAWDNLRDVEVRHGDSVTVPHVPASSVRTVDELLAEPGRVFSYRKKSASSPDVNEPDGPDQPWVVTHWELSALLGLADNREAESAVISAVDDVDRMLGARIEFDSESSMFAVNCGTSMDALKVAEIIDGLMGSKILPLARAAYPERSSLIASDRSGNLGDSSAVEGDRFAK